MPAKKPRPAASAQLEVLPRLRLNLGRDFAFGPGKAELLEHIERTGSIREAAAAMEMSYMRAWTLVKSLDRAFAEPLVLKSRGGASGGGASLSDTGRAVLRAYREIERATAGAAEQAAAPLRALLAR